MPGFEGGTSGGASGGVAAAARSEQTRETGGSGVQKTESGESVKFRILGPEGAGDTTGPDTAKKFLEMTAGLSVKDSFDWLANTKLDKFAKQAGEGKAPAENPSSENGNPNDNKVEGARKVAIYDDVNDDPDVKQVRDDILQATNSDQQVRDVAAGFKDGSYDSARDNASARESVTYWDKFVQEYPDKATAYAAKGNEEIKSALDREEKRKVIEAQKNQRQEQQQQTQSPTGAESQVPVSPTVSSAENDSTDNEVAAPAEEKVTTANGAEELKKDESVADIAEENKGVEAETKDRLSKARQGMTQFIDALKDLSDEEKKGFLADLQKQLLELQTKGKEGDKKQESSILLQILLTVALALAGATTEMAKASAKN